jgi:hypothetical protein
MRLWSNGGFLEVTIGILTLGDIFLPLFEPGARPSTRARLFATTYRAEQTGGWIRILMCPDETLCDAFVLYEKKLHTDGGRAGEHRVQLDVSIQDGGVLRVELIDRIFEGASVKPFSLELFEHDPSWPRMLLSSSARDHRPRSHVHAEIFVRWLRSLLREQASRRAARDRFDRFVDLCDRVERSNDSEDFEEHQLVLAELHEEARTLTETLGVSFFPTQQATVFMPED